MTCKISFLLKPTEKNTKQNQTKKPPQTKNNSPTKTASDPDIFFSKPAQHPAWGLDFSKELSSHLCS